MEPLAASLAGTPDALEGAASVVERIAADEAAARDERARLETEGLFRLDPQPGLDGLLEGEGVVDVRQATRVERIPGDRRADATGRLHLTTHRLILTGSERFEVDLTAIDELSLVGERLLVALANGEGLCFDIAAPRVFRVRTAYAIAHAR
jgi:hypothetical protein